MENSFDYIQETKQKDGSIIRGIIGAMIGALLGSVLWTGFGIMTEQVNTLLGLLMGFLTGLGYDLMKGRKGVARMITMLICIILAVIAGEAVYYGVKAHGWYQEEVSLLANGSDDEIAKYFYTEEDYLIYTSAAPLVKKLYIQDLKEQVAMTEKEFFQYLFTLNEYKDSFIRDLGTSLLFALLGSLVLILKPGNRNASNAYSTTVDASQSESNNPSPESDHIE